MHPNVHVKGKRAKTINMNLNYSKQKSIEHLHF